MPSSIRFDQNVSMEMRDGTLLAGEVYRPGDGGKYPAIITRAPDSGETITGGSRYIKIFIRLGHISHLFRRGHRIRIDIASSNFPTFDRNMNTGNPIGEDAEGTPALQTVYHQANYESYIDLPVIPE